MLALLVPVAVDPWVGDHQLAKAVLLAVAGSLALLGEAVGRDAGRRPGALEVLLGLFVVWALASVAWAPNPPLAWGRAALAIGTLGVFRAARASVAVGATRPVVLGMLGVGAVGMVVDGALVLVEQASGELDASAAKFSSGLFVHNNLAAGYVTLLAPLAVAMFAANRAERMRRGVQVAGVVALVGLVAYLLVLRSRAGLLGAAFGVGVTVALLALRGRIARGRTPGRAARVAAVVLVVVAAGLPFSETARGVAKDLFYEAVAVTGLDAADVQRRPVLWAKGVQMAHDHTLKGVGAGNFAVVLPRYDRLIAEVPHAHNDALQVLAELGVVGLVLFLAWLTAAAGLVGTALVRGARDGRGRALACAAGGALTVFVVSGLFETPWALGATASTIALLLGLVAGRLDADAPEAAASRAPLRRVLWTAAALTAVVSATVRVQGVRWLARAEQATARGDAGAAVDAYRRLAALPLGSHVPHAMLAEVAERAGRLDEALEHRRAASARWPHGAAVREQEGELLFALGRYGEALEAFEHALSSSPGRQDLRYKVAFALDRVGRRVEAIEMLEADVQRQRGVDVPVVLQLAQMWQREAEARLEQAAPPTREALVAAVAARHFHALVLQDGTPDLRAVAAEPFEYLTDILQRQPGSPDSWWQDVYEPWRRRHGWLHLPRTALYTSIDADGRKLYPGWEELVGPTRPPALRNSP